MLSDSYAETYGQKLFDIINDLRKNKQQLTLMQIFEKLSKNLRLYNYKTVSEISQAKNNLKILSKIIDDFEQMETFNFALLTFNLLPYVA